MIKHNKLVSICSETGVVMSSTTRTNMWHQLLIDDSENFQLDFLLAIFKHVAGKPHAELVTETMFSWNKSVQPNFQTEYLQTVKVRFK